MRSRFAYTVWLALCCVACTSTPTTDQPQGPIEPLMFLTGHPADASPLGIWCIGQQSNNSLRALPVAPELERETSYLSRLLRLGDSYWVMFESAESAWASPLDGCEPAEPLEIDGICAQLSER